MKKSILVAIILLAISPLVISYFALSKQGQDTAGQKYDEKVYVALEAEGRVSVIDTTSRKVIKSIDLSETLDNKFVKYTAHNIQVSPNGNKVLVSANVDRGTMGNENTEEPEEISDGLFDKIFIIDPVTDSIIGSIPIEIDSHLAHVVLNSSGDMAYVTSQEKGKAYAVDLNTQKITATFDLGEQSEPHGLRLSPGDSLAFVALIGGKSIASLDISTGEIKFFPLSGSVIQTAVTPDGQYIFGTVYESRRVAWINSETNEQGYIDLPSDAKGSVQLYATPDSNYLYVVNQGYYFEQSTGNTVYRINIDQKIVDQTINVGSAPHGIVVDKQGAFVYVTNLLSEDVSVIDIATNKEVTRIPVGKMPNGISLWNKTLGGTP